MCSIVLTAILAAIVVLILVSVVCFGGLITSIIFSDLFIGIAGAVGIIYLIDKYCKKK